MKNQKLQLSLLFLIPFLALIPPIVEQVRGLFSPQITVFVIAVSALMSLVIGLTLILLNSARCKQNFVACSIQIVILATIIVLYFDIGFSGITLLNRVVPFAGDLSKLGTSILHVVTVVILTLLFSIVIRKLEKEGIIVLFVLFGVAAASSFFVSGQRPLQNWAIKLEGVLEPSQRSVPELFIILDGMVGPEGIDRRVPNGEDLYRTILEFQERHGFRLFGRAFSQHSMTTTSVSNTLNFNYTEVKVDEELVTDIKGVTPKNILKNRFFDVKSSRAQEILVYQTSYLNYCDHHVVVKCKTLSLYDPFNRYVNNVQLDDKFIFYKQFKDVFVSKSIYLKYLFFSLTKIIRYFSENTASQFLSFPHQVQFVNLSFTNWFDRMNLDFLAAKNGQVFFVHVLTPHFPHDLNRNCQYKYNLWSDTEYSHGFMMAEKHGIDGAEFDQRRNIHLAEYYDQSICVFRRLDKLMTSISKKDSLKDAAIVLMGDHGPRVSRGVSYEYLSKRGLIDNHSTLFGIKSLNFEPGYDERKISVQQLFSAVQSDDLESELMNIVETIAVPSRDSGSPKIIPLPKF